MDEWESLLGAIGVPQATGASDDFMTSYWDEAGKGVQSRVDDFQRYGPNAEFTKSTLAQVAQAAGLPADFDWTPFLDQAAQQHQAQFGEPYNNRYTNYAHPAAAAIQFASASNPQLAPFVSQVGEGSAVWNQGNQMRDQALHTATSNSDWQGLATVLAGPALSAAFAPAAGAGAGASAAAPAAAPAVTGLGNAGIEAAMLGGPAATAGMSAGVGGGLSAAGTLANSGAAAGGAMGGGLGGLGSAAGTIGKTLGGSILDQITGDPSQALFNSAPALFAAYLANQQRGDIQPGIDRLTALESQFAGNQPAYLKSLTDPYDMATGQRRSDLLQSQGLRGIGGSSFGQETVNNFDYMRDTGRANLLAQGITQGVGAQGSLINSQLDAINKRNLASNAMIGAGLGASARLFQQPSNPLKDYADLFGLSNLFGAIG